MNFFNKYAMYFKLAFIGLLVAGTAYFTWGYMDAKQDKAIQTAVNDATRELGRAYNNERDRRLTLEKQVDEKYDALLTKLDGIQTGATEIRTTIVREVQGENKIFYSQQLPPTGYNQWLKSRALFQSSFSPASLPAAEPKSSTSATPPSPTPSLPSKVSLESEGRNGSPPALPTSDLLPLTKWEISFSTTTTSSALPPPASLDTTLSSNSLDRWLNENGYAQTQSLPPLQQSEAEYGLLVGVASADVTNLNPWQ